MTYYILTHIEKNQTKKFKLLLLLLKKTINSFYNQLEREREK